LLNRACAAAASQSHAMCTSPFDPYAKSISITHFKMMSVTMLRSWCFHHTGAFESKSATIRDIYFHEVEFIFGCEGHLDEKPFATSLRGQCSEARKLETYADVHKFVHVGTNAPRGVGDHYVLGFELQTRGVGQYPAVVSFSTNESSGNAKLQIRVEERPLTHDMQAARLLLSQTLPTKAADLKLGHFMCEDLLVLDQLVPGTSGACNHS
jgi:hypothetical protein